MSYIGMYDDAGSKNTFYVVKDKKIDRKRIGFKAFETLTEAKFAYKIQKILANRNLAPYVYGVVGRIRVPNTVWTGNAENGDYIYKEEMVLTNWGYLTEIARIMPECYSCDGECYDEDCKNSKVIRDVVSCLDWEGLSYSDGHRGNFGYVRRNKRWIPIVIDVGIESFDDWDSDVYGHFDHDTCEMEQEIYG